MILRKGEDTLIWKRKVWIALCGELTLEEALDLSYDRLLNEWIYIYIYKRAWRAVVPLSECVCEVFLLQWTRLCSVQNSVYIYFSFPMQYVFQLVWQYTNNWFAASHTHTYIYIYAEETWTIRERKERIVAMCEGKMLQINSGPKRD